MLLGSLAYLPTMKRNSEIDIRDNVKESYGNENVQVDTVDADVVVVSYVVELWS